MLTISRGRPGDFTLSHVHGGFLIGRLLPEQGPGPWWEYLGTASNLREAILLTQGLAAPESGRAWLGLGDEEYRELPLDLELALGASSP